MGFGESNSSLGGIATRIREVIAGRASAFLRQTTPGQPRTSEHEDAPDIPDLELLRRIGHGSYGEVWLARNIVGSYRAVKIINRKAFRDEEAFEREFFGLQRFEPISREHAGFVEILHVGRSRADGYFYYVMELADDDSNGDKIDPDRYVPKTLSSELARCGRLSVEESVQLGLSLNEALIELHRRGLVHRDIKPSNIIFVKSHAKLADIGLVAHVGEKKRLGTEGYIPPEGPGTAQGDLYSLGKLLYETSTGTDRLDYPALPPNLDMMPDREAFLQLNSIILKACDNDLRKRYQTATEMNDDLAQLGVIEKPAPTDARNLTRKRVIALATAASLIAMTAATGVFLWKSNFFHSAPPKSIAVLPFENLSDDKQNSHFAEGIREQVLTQLVKVADLKVISRTSTQGYPSHPRNLREIARQLGVVTILEGSVQKAADEVRISVRLINAQSDSHLWAETYDRKLTDIFGVESEIARGIVESLQAKLTGREEQARVTKPTNNPEAYDAYLRGLAFEAYYYYDYSDDAIKKATGFFEQAVQLDPNFALAWERLARADAVLYFNRGSTPVREAAKEALEKAQKLQPNSPETLLALGYYQYWVQHDYDLARTTFELVSKMLPGSSEVPTALGLIARRRGHWDESIAYLEQALVLDPRNSQLLNQTAETLVMLRQFRAALKLYDHALDITPNDPDLLASEAAIYQAQGNLQEAAKFLSEISEETPSENTLGIKLKQLRLERNYDQAMRVLQTRLDRFHYAFELVKGLDQMSLAFFQRLAGDSPGAKFTAKQAHDTWTALFENQPNSPDVLMNLALADSVMGQKDSALKQAAQAIILLPSAKDPLVEPGLEENLALICAMFGENDRAISTLTRLLRTPYITWLYGTPVTPALLRLDPLWDPLRTDPAFRKLCDEKQQ